MEKNSFFHRLSTVVQEVWDALVKKPTQNLSRSSRILAQKASQDIPAELATDLLPPPTSGARSSGLPQPAEPVAYATAPLLRGSESPAAQAAAEERLRSLGPVSGFAPIHVDKIETEKEEKKDVEPKSFSQANGTCAKAPQQ
jgi:hypothetical protein